MTKEENGKQTLSKLVGGGQINNMKLKTPIQRKYTHQMKGVAGKMIIKNFRYC
jgi:hypothetical protein